MQDIPWYPHIIIVRKKTWDIHCFNHGISQFPPRLRERKQLEERQQQQEEAIAMIMTNAMEKSLLYTSILISIYIIVSTIY